MAYRNFKGYGKSRSRDNQIIINVILLPLYLLTGILKLFGKRR